MVTRLLVVSLLTMSPGRFSVSEGPATCACDVGEGARKQMYPPANARPRHHVLRTDLCSAKAAEARNWPCLTCSIVVGRFHASCIQYEQVPFGIRRDCIPRPAGLASCLVLRGGKTKATTSAAVDTKKSAASQCSVGAQPCVSPLSAALQRAKRQRKACHHDDSPSASPVEDHETPSPTTLPNLLASGSLNAPQTGAYLPVRRDFHSFACMHHFVCSISSWKRA